MQSPLDLLTDWASIWQLQLSVAKYFILHVDLGKLQCDVALYIDRNMLPVVQTCRDLEVTVSSDLLQVVQIDQIVAKAHQRANCIIAYCTVLYQCHVMYSL